MAEQEKMGELTRDFSRVILTLENVLVPEEKLSVTPSRLDGLEHDTETDLRILGCELIQTSGILLKLPQVTMATAQVLFQRFYYFKSFVKHNMEIVAMACLYLASKIEEALRRIRDIINVFHHIKQIHNKKTISPLILDQNYINLKNQVIKAERRILKELGFCVHVAHPHKVIVIFLQVLNQEKNKKLVQCAWNYMNDSFRTPVFMRYHPETIACACIYLAARQLQIPLPNSPPWYWLFSVDEDHLQSICRSILKLYTRSKPNIDELEHIVNECKKVHIEAKLKAKGLASETGTPNSRPISPAKMSPSPLNLPSTKKLKNEDENSDSSFGAQLNHAQGGKKRARSRSVDSRARSRSASRSKSRSYHSSSRSVSRSPARGKHRYNTPPPKKYKKDAHRKSSKEKRRRDRERDRERDRDRGERGERERERDHDRIRERDYDYEHGYKDNNKHARKHRRASPSPLPPPPVVVARSSSPSYSRSPDYQVSHNSHKKYHKDKTKYRSRSRTPQAPPPPPPPPPARSRDRPRAKKHNGHRRSHSREEHYRR